MGVRGRKIDTQHDELIAAAVVARKSYAEISAETGIAYQQVRRTVIRLGLVPDGIRAGRRPSGIRDPRSPLMAALYQNGRTLEQIGAEYGITRERVRQILRKHTSVTKADGGVAVRSARRKAKIATAKDLEYMQHCGCTFEEWRQIKRLGKELMAAGLPRGRTPLYAYNCQKRNAHERGIGWELTFGQWWGIWDASGKFNQRGRGQGYCMSRVGDTGPYALGNVFIAPSRENSSNQARKQSALPIGVRQVKGGRFSAKRMIGGRVRYLGIYPTAEQAHAAYLAADPSFREAA